MNRTNRLTLAIRHTTPIAFAALLFTAGTAIWLQVGIPVASAAPAPSIKVRYDDLNLGTSAGVEELYRRIKGAAEIVCRQEMYPVDLAFAPRWRLCYDEAVADAVGKVNNTQLTAMHHRGGQKGAS